MRTHLPFLKIEPNCLTEYWLAYDYDNQSEYATTASYKNRHDITCEQSTVKGELSFHAIRRLRRAINLLVAISPRKKQEYFDRPGWYWYRLGFLTLKLPGPQGDISDETIKRQALMPYLQDLRRKYGLRHYIWKAEAQGNGNIHFHLTINTFIRYDHLRTLWNKHLNKLGFIDLYQKRMQEFHSGGFTLREDLLGHWPRERQEQAYDRGMATNWTDPNSTDIHAVKNIRKMASYMVKYMCKNEPDRRKIKGKIWDCSKSLKQKVDCTLELDTQHSREWNLLKSKLPKSVRKLDYSTILLTHPDKIMHLLPPKMKAAYQDYLTQIKHTEPFP